MVYFSQFKLASGLAKKTTRKHILYQNLLLLTVLILLYTVLRIRGYLNGKREQSRYVGTAVPEGEAGCEATKRDGRVGLQQYLEDGGVESRVSVHVEEGVVLEQLLKKGDEAGLLQHPQARLHAVDPVQFDLVYGIKRATQDEWKRQRSNRRTCDMIEQENSLL